MRFWLIVISVFTLAACKGPTEIVDPKPLSGIDRDAALTDARRFLGSDAKIVAICGPSVGRILYLDRDVAKIEPDSIKDGVIALGFDANGKPDVVHRDAFKKMIRVTEDSGEITFIPQPGDDNLGTWSIVFRATGIVESHSLVRKPTGDLYDLWTSTRNYGLTLPRSLVFLSKCEAV